MKFKLFFIAVFIFYFFPFSFSLSLTMKKTTVTLPDGEKINVRVADTSMTRSTGLIGRSHLDSNEGMLFLFETTEPHLMWMKNMLIPIDIVWLNESKEIVEMVQSISPCSIDPCAIYGPSFPSRYVLELKEGSANRFHLKKGMVLKFP